MSRQEDYSKIKSKITAILIRQHTLMTCNIIKNKIRLKQKNQNLINKINKFNGSVTLQHLCFL